MAVEAIDNLLIKIWEHFSSVEFCRNFFEIHFENPRIHVQVFFRPSVSFRDIKIYREDKFPFRLSRISSNSINRD